MSIAVKARSTLEGYTGYIIMYEGSGNNRRHICQLTIPVTRDNKAQAIADANLLKRKIREG